MTKDLNKNISSIGYNLLNLPTNITYSSGKSAAYIYDATGRKLRTSYKASASATPVPTDYCGNMIYENGVLKQILVDGGYMTVTGTPFYYYYLQDHLGSNRVVVNTGGTATQVNHYYPFGGLFGESTGNTVQRFKYNGKELDRTHGIDWYDYGARHMTPDAGRFTTIDPLAEKYYNISPYAYCANNPLSYIDPSGKYITYTNNSNKKTYVYYKGNFYHKKFKRVNGHLVPKGSKVFVPKNSYMLRTLQALRKMENSQNETIKEVFNVVSDIDGGKEHNIHAGLTGKGSFTRHEGRGITTTSLNFEEDNKNIKENENESFTDYEVIGHELKHAYDYQIEKNSSEEDENGVQYDEYRAVQFENLIRNEENRPMRTTYGTHPLPKEYLN